MGKNNRNIKLLILLSFMMLTFCGCGLSRELEEWETQISDMINTSEGQAIAERLKEHKTQLESTEILKEEESGQEAETEIKSQEEAKETEAFSTPDSDAHAMESRYYYMYLSDTMRTIYREIYESILERKEVELSTLSTDNLDIAFQSVLNDYPEIFYVKGYHCTEVKRGDELVKIKFTADYDKSPEEVKEAQTKIDAYKSNCFAGILESMSEYEKVKYIFDYIITNTEYDLNAPDNQNICSVFIENKSVCQGYAEATEYLLRELGFQVTIVTGTVEKGDRHAWNLVMVDGSYYYLDTTWGDVDYQSAEGLEAEVDKSVMPINYDYFLITTNQLTKTHRIENILPLPACVAYDNNYYHKEGLYFENLDEEKLQGIFDAAFETEKGSVTIKCGNEEVYSQMCQYLLDENRIFQYLRSMKSVSYYDNPNMQTLCFWIE